MIQIVNIHESSLISKLEYDDETKDLTIYFKKYYVESLTYENVSINVFDEMFTSKSAGQFYLYYIKKYFSLKQPKNTMATRFLKLKIDVTKIDKSMLFTGEKGTYLNCTVHLKDEKDAFGNNSMVTQDVPKSIFDKEKNLPADKKTKGAILGNGMEWEKQGMSEEQKPGSEAGLTLGDAKEDDLPF